MIARRRIVARLLLTAVAVVGAGGCGLIEPGDERATSEATVAQEGASSEPVPTITATVTPAPPAQLLLTDQGVGAVSFTTPGAYDSLVELLGEPTTPATESCSFWFANWGGLSVYFDEPDGAASGWSLHGGPLADQVQPPYGVYPADPIRPVLEQGGIASPSYSFEDPETISEYRTSIGAYAWDTPTDDPDSPVTRISVSAPGCD